MPVQADIFKIYFEQLKKYDPRESTEHTLRPALHNLLTALALQQNPKIIVIPEPKHDESGHGAPDVKFKIGESILGYLENKKIDANLDQVLKSEQIAKYKKLSGNLLLTNYLEWLWLKDGAVIGRETLAYQSDVGFHKARLDPDKAEKVACLIANFYSTPPKGISKVKDLALALATRCHDLREFLEEELKRQEKEHQEGRLFGLYNVFKKDVFHELSLEGFADAFAQMLGYGLFLARLNSDKESVTLDNAKKYIPSNFELIRELVDFLDELDKQEYSRIKWLVEEILSIMNNLDLPEVLEGLAFTKRQRRLLEQTEEERLFAKDPYVYFYEDFLKAYDASMRKSRGVYYTPPPVVNFIVRAINDILKDTFEIKDGLADRKRVTVLDFATGTGTFLLEVLQQILDGTSEGVRDQVIREHALKNLYGFEYLIAPYTIAHLKLSQFLHGKGYTMQPKERLQIYLTNTLEPISPQHNYLLPELSKEVEQAQNVKEKAILVITGNPPYSGISQNKGTWISNLIGSYKIVDGKPFGEKKHWLNDDYVKFIRFAQWKMDQVDEGIVGIITNHSFLDNPTFRGMRQSLMKTFNQIYIFDLHGNSKTQEKAPDGRKDENIFDILQGVTVSILVKKAGVKSGISRADVWGTRLEKYSFCMNQSINSLKWDKLTPVSPYYLFKSYGQSPIYQKDFIGLKEIFAVDGVGIQSSRDDFVVDTELHELKKRISKFADIQILDNLLRHEYNLKNTRGWDLRVARERLTKDNEWEFNFKLIHYRPFDFRFTYYADYMIDWPRRQIMRHMMSENVGMCIGRQFGATGSDDFDIAFVSDKPIDMNLYRRGGELIFPLYLYNFSNDKKTKPSLFDEPVPPSGTNKRVENFAPDFRKFIDKKYGHAYNPEDIMGYIYAVLYSPTYRRKYTDVLKIDFPRIPFVDDRKQFEKLSKLGWELVQAHLLKEIPAAPKVEITKGSDLVEKPVYGASNQRLYINTQQYFAPVPEDVWNFHIGGYQVLDKYLKSRKGRALNLDEKENIINVVKVLRFTIDQMKKIDQV